MSEPEGRANHEHGVCLCHEAAALIGARQAATNVGWRQMRWCTNECWRADAFAESLTAAAPATVEAYRRDLDHFATWAARARRPRPCRGRPQGAPSLSRPSRDSVAMPGGPSPARRPHCAGTSRGWSTRGVLEHRSVHRPVGPDGRRPTSARASSRRAPLLLDAPSAQTPEATLPIGGLATCVATTRSWSCSTAVVCGSPSSARSTIGDLDLPCRPVASGARAPSSASFRERSGRGRVCGRGSAKVAMCSSGRTACRPASS